MLELVWVSGVNGDNRAVYVELTHKRAVWAEFWSESIGAAFPQTQQTDENILFRIFVRNEGFPALIGHIISSNQLNIFRLNLEVYFLDADFSCPHISAGNVHFPHFSECQLSQITFLYSRSDQGHWDISLNSVDSHPRRH